LIFSVCASKIASDNIPNIDYMPLETYKEKEVFDKVVGTVDLGTYKLLIYPRPQGGYFFKAAKANRADFLNKVTRDLAPHMNAVFAGLDPDLLNLIETSGILSPQVTWRSGSGILDEPQISITGNDAFDFSVSKATLYDNEVVDLFSKSKNSKDFKSASFVSMNTAVGDVMGIAVRRNNPVVILLAPSIDGSRMSSKEGLNNLLSGILGGMTSRLSTFEVQVLNSLAEANANGYFQLPYDQTTLGGKLQNNLLMQVFTAKVFFLAREAETNGMGMNHAALLEHFPYLKSAGKTGLAAMVSGAPKNQKLDPSIWDELVEDGSRGVNLKNPGDKTPRPTSLKPLEQRGVTYITQKIATQTSNQSSVEAKPTAVINTKPAISVDTEKTESVAMLKKPIESLAKSLGAYSFIRADRISSQDMATTAIKLEQIKAEFKQIVSSKKIGRPPVTATPVDFQASSSKLKAFGISGGPILEFLSPTKGKDYRSIVEEATFAWIADSNHQDVNLRNNPKVRLADSLQSSDRLKKLAEHIMTALNLRDVRMINRGYDLVYMSYCLLVEKTIYALSESGRQLCQNGQSIEIINWAHYCNVVLERLIKLGTDIK